MGCSDSSKVAVGFVKAANEHRLLSSEIEDDRDRSMAGFPDHLGLHAALSVEVDLPVGEPFARKQPLGCHAVWAKCAAVHQEILVGFAGVLEHKAIHVP